MQLLASDETEMSGAPSEKQRAILHSLLAPVSPFVRWWLKEMKELMPQKLRCFFSEPRLLVRASHGELCIVDVNVAEGQEYCRPLGAGDGAMDTGHSSAARRCDLLLDKSLVLEHELELPLDAEASLRRVLSFSMDRYTPFNENDVFFDYKVLGRDSVSRKLTLQLYVAPRESIEPLIGRLAEQGLEVATLDVSTEAANERGNVNLLSPDRRPGGAGMGRRERLLAGSAFLLLLVALVLPFALRQQAVTKMEGQVEQLRGQLKQAEANRMELTARIEQMRQIQTRNTVMPAMLDVLFELTRLMPDDAWAGQVALKDGRVRLTGEAGAASDLLSRLSSSPLFSDPKFEAPLTQNPKTGRERFVISLAIKGYSNGA